MQQEQACAPRQLAQGLMRRSVASLPQSTENVGAIACLRGAMRLKVRRIGNADDTATREVSIYPKTFAHPGILGLQVVAVSWRPKWIALRGLTTLSADIIMQAA